MCQDSHRKTESAYLTWKCFFSGSLRSVCSTNNSDKISYVIFQIGLLNRAENRIECLQLFLSSFGDPIINICDARGRTPLHVAGNVRVKNISNKLYKAI